MPGSLLRRVRELPPMVADGLLAALVTLIGLPRLFILNEDLARLGIEFRDVDALALLLTLAQTVPLVWRRRAPMAVLAVTGLAALAHLVIGYQPTWAEFGMLVAFYTVAAHRPRRQTAVAAALVAAGLTVYVLVWLSRHPMPAGQAVSNSVVSYVQFAAAWFLGDVQKRRLAYTAKLEALNAQLAAEQELRSRWAVTEERGRIARELHDVVAHSVSVMVVQAGAARRTLAASPDQAAAALGQIESTGRQALVEMRRLLGLLRDGDREDAAALAPQPSLEHLESLAAAAREAGLPVEVTVEGEPRPLPAGVDLSAYRIVQEALTNSLKHAGPARAEVRIRYGRDVLEVQVTDDGLGGRGAATAVSGSGLVVVTLGRHGAVRNGVESASGRRSIDSDRRDRRSGHGLIGMRERVALFGGTLEAGARPGGGYRVAARLPLDGGLQR
jgi:signal transduction histidine kinase